MSNYKYTIKTLTPIHIGSGKTIQRNHEYVYLPQEKAFAFLEDEKVLELIGVENIDKWMSIIERQEDLLPYLRQRSKGNVQSSAIARYVVPLQGRGNVEVKQIGTQLRNGQGRPYLPGSSFKGAVKTALLSAYLEEDEKESFFERKANFTDKRNRYSDKTMMKRYFGEDPNHDFFRLLQLGDAHFEETETVGLLAQSVNLKARGWEMDRRLQQYIECIPAGVEAAMNMHYHETLVKMAAATPLSKRQNRGRRDDYRGRRETYHLFDGKKVEDLEQAALFDLLNQHTAFMIGEELYFWKREERYPKQVQHYIAELQKLQDRVDAIIEAEDTSRCILRLGWGTGFKNMTGDWQEDKLSEDIYEDLIQSLKKHKYDRSPFPKTRRMTESGQPLGYVEWVSNVE